ncbi:MAG: hypothetical protein ABIT71_12270 [Vicinamibacteraceae bacterium]
MLDLLESFRIHAAGRPLLITLAIAIVLVLLGGRRPAGRELPPRIGIVIATIGAAAIAAYVTSVVWYASDTHYFDAAEPTMTIVGWLSTQGQPLYHDPASAERYAHIYGPLAFLAHGLVQRLFGAGIEPSKWLGAAAGLIGLGATGLALTAVTTRHRALALTGGCALVYLAFRNYTFWARPDALLVAGVALGLLVAVRARGLAASIGVGLVVGLLANLKFTGPVYAAPLIAILAFGARPTLALVALAVAAVTAAAPFALPNVSLAAYVAWVRLSAANGLMLAILRQNIEWIAFLLLPIAVLWFGVPADARPRDRTWIAGMALLVAGMAAVAVAASKPGAGPYHLLPFVPLVAYAAARILGERRLIGGDPTAAPVALAWVLAAAIIAIAWHVSFVRVMQEARSRDEAGDIASYLEAHPRVVAQMAYNGYDRPTYARPLLTFRSGLYLIDAPAVQEHQQSRLALPEATVDAIRQCRADVWLVPRGTEPFVGPSRYPAVALAPIFPDALRAAFHKAYVADGHTAYFDVWRCRAKAVP